VATFGITSLACKVQNVYTACSKAFLFHDEEGGKEETVPTVRPKFAAKQNLNSTSYDADTARACAVAIKEVWHATPDSDHYQVLCGKYPDSAPYAIKVVTDDYVMLAFRGTDVRCWQEIQTDLDTSLDNVGNDYGFHSGFLNLWRKDMWFKVVDALSTEDLANKKLYITGHSLGAAFALLTILTIPPKYNAHIQTYLFGSPRCGDSRLKSSLSKLDGVHIYNLQNLDDPVIALPPAVAPNYAQPKDPHIFTHVGRRYVACGDSHASLSQHHAISTYERMIDHFLLVPENT